MRTTSILLLAALSLAPSAVRGEGPATQPAQPTERGPRGMRGENRGPRDESGRPFERGFRPDRGLGRGPEQGDLNPNSDDANGAGERSAEVSAEEWEQITSFMEAHSPKRWAFFLQIKENRPQQAVDAIKGRIVERYRWLKKIEANQKLYATAVSQIEAEDELWVTLKNYRDNDTPENKAALRDKVYASVQQNLKEREEKLAKLREAVAHEQDQLVKDRQRIEQIVDNQMDRLTTQENPFGGPPPNWGRGGPRRPGPMGGQPMGDRAQPDSNQPSQPRPSGE